jgi:hypothetical protein
LRRVLQIRSYDQLALSATHPQLKRLSRFILLFLRAQLIHYSLLLVAIGHKLLKFLLLE